MVGTYKGVLAQKVLGPSKLKCALCVIVQCLQTKQLFKPSVVK